MLFTAALVLLAGWMLERIGAYHIGSAAHLFLLAGLMLLLIAFLQARDAAMRTPHSDAKKTE